MSELTVDDIPRLLPHRYPFLLIDTVLELEPEVRIVGLKQVTLDEPFFPGHFPGDPVMPGLLIVEALAQAGALLLLGALDDSAHKLVYFASLDNAQWQGTVRPGDQLRLEVDATQRRGRMHKVHARALVGSTCVCEADFGAMVVDR